MCLLFSDTVEKTSIALNTSKPLSKCHKHGKEASSNASEPSKTNPLLEESIVRYKKDETTGNGIRTEVSKNIP